MSTEAELNQQLKSLIERYGEWTYDIPLPYGSGRAVTRAIRTRASEETLAPPNTGSGGPRRP